MNIFENKITAQNVKVIWEQDDRRPFLGETFFTPTTQVGLDINLIKGKKGLPIALVSANWDTKVLYRDRIGFKTLQAEIPYFKEAYSVNENLRRQIITIKEQYQGKLFNEVFDDIYDLVIGADVTVERMRMQLLSTGTISIQENGVDKQYDYGFSTSEQLKQETTLWSASGAKPFASFNTQIRNYKKLTKKVARYCVMNTDVFDKLANDTEILNYFAKLSTPNLYPSDEEIKTFIERKTGVIIFINDAQYIAPRDKTLTAVDFYPQDRYTLFSTLDLGESVYTETPEEVDMKSGESAFLTGEVLGNGIAVTTWKEPDPVCVNTKVVEAVLPSCPNIDLIYIVKVL